jgi:uncharacterized membrane protein YhiD involved in acid resistance
MAIGFGALIEALGTTLLVLIALVPLRKVEEMAALRPEDDEGPS